MNIVEILNRLIAVSIVSEKTLSPHGERRAERTPLEKFFQSQSHNRKAAADELSAVRRKINGDRNEHGTLTGLAGTGPRSDFFKGTTGLPFPRQPQRGS